MASAEMTSNYLSKIGHWSRNPLLWPFTPVRTLAGKYDIPICGYGRESIVIDGGDYVTVFPRNRKGPNEIYRQYYTRQLAHIICPDNFPALEGLEEVESAHGAFLGIRVEKIRHDDTVIERPFSQAFNLLLHLRMPFGFDLERSNLHVQNGNQYYIDSIYLTNHPITETLVRRVTQYLYSNGTPDSDVAQAAFCLKQLQRPTPLAE